RVVDGEAPNSRNYLRNAGVTLKALDVQSGELTDATYADTFELITQTGVYVFQRERAQMAQPEFLQRIAGRDRKSRVALIEREQIELVVKALQREAKRHIQKPGLGVADVVILVEETKLSRSRNRLTTAEQFGVADAEIAEDRRRAVIAAAQLQR